MRTNKNSNEELVKDYQSGNKIALTELVKRWHKTFCNKAYWLVKDKDVAKDIAQDSWKTIIDKLSSLKEPKSFGSWAISIVNRKSIDWIRARNREWNNLKKISEEKSKALFEESTGNQEEMKILLLKTIKTLPNHQQMVLKLFYTQNYTLNEISKLLKISVGTVKSRLFHAREKLKITFKHRNYED